MSPSKIVSGLKKTTIRKATKAGKSDPYQENNIRRRPREEVLLLNSRPERACFCPREVVS